MTKLITLLKICGALLTSYFIVTFFGTKLFVDNTPTIDMQYIASFREAPSLVSVYISSLGSLFSNPDKEIQKQVDEYKKETGAVEVAVSEEEQKTLVDSMSNPENPVPNAVFNFVSKGVAASAPDKNGKVILRMDENTKKNIQYKRFTRKDGTTLDIMILK